MKSNFIQIHPKDNVAVALEDVKKGCDVIINGFSQRMEVLEDISFGHKMPWMISKGRYGHKVGAPIGHAVTSIKAWVHTTMSGQIRGKLEYTYNPVPAKKVDVRNRGVLKATKS